ncbi:MAG: hypothetical protein KatS3mg105_4089 [Gemmatales bacterium]|nr:MAG: hypothetical protein KatS3mg105_4089 [Gemmatales bacterium]
MQLLDPKILQACHGLSWGVCAIGLVIGLALWATGWWWHRFWIVSFSTAMGGFIGLWASQWYATKPLVVSLLLALAVGMMSLALIRVVAFVMCGSAVYLLVHFQAPVSWDAPLPWFLAGGLLGIVLFRLWMMVLTSCAGTLLAGYSALSLLDYVGKIQAADFASAKGALLTGICYGGIIGGVGLQVWIDRRRRRREEAETVPAAQPTASSASSRPWMTWRPYRRAG